MNFNLCFQEQIGWGGLVMQPTENTVTVEVERLDNILPPDTNVAALKVDTEGADTWVLFGAEKALAEQRIKNVFFEQNQSRMNQLGINRDEAKAFLSKLGYKVVPLTNDNSCCEFHAFPVSRFFPSRSNHEEKKT